MFDLQSRLSSLTHLGASWVLWTLIGLSILGVAIVLERALAFLLARDDLESLERELVRMVSAGDLEGARSRAASSRAYESWMVRAGLTAPGDAAATEQRMMAASTKAKLAMERRLAFLGTLGSNAPFLGLLGTVVGIVRSFQALDVSGGKVSAGLMAEVGEALVATAIGILVALPSVAAFNTFQRMIKVRLARAEALGRNVLAAFRPEGV
jgi:biopolymer transport protein ExbB/TolQ